MRAKLGDIQQVDATTDNSQPPTNALEALLKQADEILKDDEVDTKMYRTLAANIAQEVTTTEAQLRDLRNLHPSSEVSQLITELDALLIDADTKRRALLHRSSALRRLTRQLSFATIPEDSVYRSFESSASNVSLADGTHVNLDTEKVLNCLMYRSYKSCLYFSGLRSISKRKKS